MTTKTKPVVAVDVDGVLNASFPTASGFAHRLHVPAADVARSPFVKDGGARDLDMILNLDAGHGYWLNALLDDGVDVVWATTWEDAANKYLAPLLGLPPLPVATSVTVSPPKFGMARDGDVAGWKAMALEDRYPGRPLVWIDDLAWDYAVPEPAPLPPDLLALGLTFDDDGPAWRSPDPTLVVVPRAEVGLTHAEMALVDTWLGQYR